MNNTYDIITEEDAYDLIKENPHYISYVKKNWMTPEFIKKCIQINPDVLNHIDYIKCSFLKVTSVEDADYDEIYEIPSYKNKKTTHKDFIKSFVTKWNTTFNGTTNPLNSESSRDLDNSDNAINTLPYIKGNRFELSNSSSSSYYSSDSSSESSSSILDNSTLSEFDDSTYLLTCDESDKIVAKKVYYENVVTGTLHLVNNNLQSIEENIHEYIKNRYGVDNLELAIQFNDSSETMTTIKNNGKFENGVFYIKLVNGKYDIYKKVTTYEEHFSWMSGTYKKPIYSVEKMRTYGIINV